jgi:hypothetical protein
MNRHRPILGTRRGKPIAFNYPDPDGKWVSTDEIGAALAITRFFQWAARSAFDDWNRVALLADAEDKPVLCPVCQEPLGW